MGLGMKHKKADLLLPVTLIMVFDNCGRVVTDLRCILHTQSILIKTGVASGSDVDLLQLLSIQVEKNFQKTLLLK